MRVRGWITFPIAIALLSGCGTSESPSGTGGGATCNYEEDDSESAQVFEHVTSTSTYSAGNEGLADAVVGATVEQDFGCPKKATVETTLESSDQSGASIVCSAVGGAYSLNPPDEVEVLDSQGSLLTSC